MLYSAAWDGPHPKPTRQKPIRLGINRPNAGIEAAYSDRLTKMIDEMERSVLWWVRAAYKANTPKIALALDKGMGASSSVLALDDMASFVLARAMQELRKRWLKSFDRASKRWARYFAASVGKRTDEQLKKILRDGGFTVKWDMSPAQKDVLEAIVAENVVLIKSIPQEALGRVEGAVMRSVQEGRNLKSLTDELVKGFGVTKRRARFIARDQNNKATSLLQRVRFVENGVTECIWMHSSAGKTPRPSHVKAGRDKISFDPKMGWWDPHLSKYIWPGTEPNCRCTCRPVVKGFE
jgi:SPP1 gp7 family putative phage head morphogenesis protein